MVLVQFKKSEKNNFTLSFDSNILVSQIMDKIIQINNLRIYLDRLIWSVQQLATKGVLKPSQLQGVSFEDYQKNPNQFAQLPKNKKIFGLKPKVISPYRYVSDKNNQRFGVILSEQKTKPLLEAVNKGKQIMEAKKTIINKQQILQCIEDLRFAVASAYPAYINLPEWEPTFLMLQEKIDLEILQSENFEFYTKKSSLWWAGKELDKKKKLCEYTGTNQKTKIIVKLQKPGDNQPNREPPVDSETYAQMVRYYYKKVDQNKQFQKKNPQTYYEHVEVKSMKAKLHLDNDIRYKPF